MPDSYDAKSPAHCPSRYGKVQGIRTSMNIVSWSYTSPKLDDIFEVERDLHFDATELLSIAFGVDIGAGHSGFTALVQRCRAAGISVEGDRGPSDLGWSASFDFAGPTSRGPVYVNLGSSVLDEPHSLAGSTVRIKNAGGVGLGKAICESLGAHVRRFGAPAISRSVFHDLELRTFIHRQNREARNPLKWYSWIVLIVGETHDVVSIDQIHRLAAGTLRATGPDGVDVTIAYGFDDPADPPPDSWWSDWREALRPALSLVKLQPSATFPERPTGICPADWADT